MGPKRRDGRASSLLPARAYRIRQRMMCFCLRIAFRYITYTPFVQVGPIIMEQALFVNSFLLIAGDKKNLSQRQKKGPMASTIGPFLYIRDFPVFEEFFHIILPINRQKAALSGDVADEERVLLLQLDGREPLKNRVVP